MSENSILEKVPWFVAHPRYGKLDLHYYWTYRRNPRVHTVDENDPVVRLLPRFRYNRASAAAPAFHHQIRDNAHYLASVDLRIEEFIAWHECMIRRLAKRELALFGPDPRVNEMKSIRERIARLRLQGRLDSKPEVGEEDDPRLVEVEIADLCERYRAIWWDTETREVVYPAVDDAA